jgi:hypothetical protein
MVSDFHQTALALAELRLNHFELVALAIASTGLLHKLALDIIDISLIALLLGGLKIIF